MSRLNYLATLAGIDVHYKDMWQKSHPVPEKTLVALLTSLGYAAKSDDDISLSISQLENEEKKQLSDITVLGENRIYRLQIDAAVSWQLTNEKDETQHGETEQGQVKLPELNYGYYNLKVILRNGEEQKSRLIVAPPKCWLPEPIEKGKRIWGIAAQLYSLRTNKNWGIGDFYDLGELIEKGAAAGADTVGLNPINAMFPGNPLHISPYSPSDRLLLNTIYIDVEAVDNFADNREAQKLWQDDEFQLALKSAQAAEFVDYKTIADLKIKILRVLFRTIDLDMRAKFNQFCVEQGSRLRNKAIFDALSAHFDKKNNRITSFHEWPESYRLFDSNDVKSFATVNVEQVDFHCWLQFVADRQLQRAQSIALQKGMVIGLYRDQAVGSDGSGAEVWVEPDAYMKGVSVGAPPDESNLKGQNWGLPSLSPTYLRRTGYRPFIDLLRANMRHARALRIDHAFGLSRLFLIPHGMEGSEATYLNYKFEEMLAVLRIETHRNQCMVIGEDLGTFPDNYKEGAAASGLLSYKIFSFERTEDNNFQSPKKYPYLSLATLSTHDLPTVAGWLQEKDIGIKQQLDLYPSDDFRMRDVTGRARDKAFMLSILEKSGLNDQSDMRDQIEAIQLHLADSSSAVVMLQLEEYTKYCRANKFSRYGGRTSKLEAPPDSHAG